LGYQLASAIARGFAPPIATALFSGYGYPAVALHTTVVALITIVTVHLATEAYQRVLPGEGTTRNALLPETRP